MKDVYDSEVIEFARNFGINPKLAENLIMFFESDRWNEFVDQDVSLGDMYNERYSCDDMMKHALEMIHKLNRVHKASQVLMSELETALYSNGLSAQEIAYAKAWGE